MEKLSFIKIIFFLYLFSFIFNNESEKSSYSQLFDEIREYKVDKVLSSLPKRENTNILSMFIIMNNIKEENSLNDAEAAFLTYKWIAQNIEVDCSDNDNNESAVIAYNSGKANFLGISNLFKTMCFHLNLKVDIISGYIKKLTNNDDGRIIEKIKSFWNYILINDTYYLVDASMGAGTCDGDEFNKDNNDFFFATKPELFVRSHYPDMSKWQLLDKAIEDFTSMAFLRQFFYLNGFRTISPDYESLNLKKDSKIVLTFDKYNDDISVSVFYVTFDGNDFDYLSYDDFTISRGIVEVNLNLNTFDKNVVGLIIYAGKIDDENLSSIAVYSVNY